MKWILASKSPRRRELLSRFVTDFDIVVSDANESYGATKPSEIVKELAKLKCDAIKDIDKSDTIVISSDTIVWADDEAIGKPKDLEDCERMMRKMSGKAHQVYTGLCVRHYYNNEVVTEDLIAEKTDVYFDELSDDEINEYIHTDEPYDKAGGYAVQGIFSKYISRLDGDFYTVVGFPVNAFYKIIKKNHYL
jgi:septum formation protein